MASRGVPGCRPISRSLSWRVTTDSTLPSMELRTGRPGPCRNFSKPLGSMYLNSASHMLAARLARIVELAGMAHTPACGHKDIHPRVLRHCRLAEDAVAHHQVIKAIHLGRQGAALPRRCAARLHGPHTGLFIEHRALRRGGHAQEWHQSEVLGI